MIPTLATVKAMAAALHNAYLVCLLKRRMRRYFSVYSLSLCQDNIRLFVIKLAYN